MKQSKILFPLILSVGLFCGGWVWGGDASAAEPNPCAADVAQFCANTTTGPAGMVALMDCLEEHEKELSPACREFEAKMGGARVERSEAVREKRQFRDRCLGDMGKFCSDAAPTQGGMLNCLSRHENELSDPCRESINAMK